MQLLTIVQDVPTRRGEQACVEKPRCLWRDSRGAPGSRLFPTVLLRTGLFPFLPACTTTYGSERSRTPPPAAAPPAPSPTLFTFLELLPLRRFFELFPPRRFLELPMSTRFLELPGRTAPNLGAPSALDRLFARMRCTRRLAGRALGSKDLRLPPPGGADHGVFGRPPPCAECAALPGRRKVQLSVQWRGARTVLDG